MADEKNKQTKKELEKECRQKLLTKLSFLKQQIQSINPSNSEELLFCVGEMEKLCKSYAECFRLIRYVCFCGRNDKDDRKYKNLLYAEYKEILEH